MFKSAIFFVRDVIQFLDQGAQTVAVRRNQNALSGADHRSDRAFPVRKHPRNGILERLGQR
jgi:hypothetical protein